MRGTGSGKFSVLFLGSYFKRRALPPGSCRPHFQRMRRVRYLVPDPCLIPPGETPRLYRRRNARRHDAPEGLLSFASVEVPPAPWR